MPRGSSAELFPPSTNLASALRSSPYPLTLRLPVSYDFSPCFSALLISTFAESHTPRKQTRSTKSHTPRAKHPHPRSLPLTRRATRRVSTSTQRPGPLCTSFRTPAFAPLIVCKTSLVRLRHGALLPKSRRHPALGRISRLFSSPPSMFFAAVKKVLFWLPERLRKPVRHRSSTRWSPDRPTTPGASSTPTRAPASRTSAASASLTSTSCGTG